MEHGAEDRTRAGNIGMTVEISPFNKFRLDGKLALITGASRGLGQHFVSVLAGAGARVALATRRVDKLQERVDALLASGMRHVLTPWMSRMQRASKSL